MVACEQPLARGHDGGKLRPPVNEPPPRPPQELPKTEFIDRGLQEPNGVRLFSMKILINVEIETSS